MDWKEQACPWHVDVMDPESPASASWYLHPLVPAILFALIAVTVALTIEYCH
jgi:hypothetical protein